MSIRGTRGRCLFPPARPAEYHGPMEAPGDSPAILLFDGVCNLCNASVNFIIDRDPQAYFRFAPLQSETGRRLLEKHGLPTGSMDTVVLVEDDRAYVRSTAALRIARHLVFPWPLLALGLILPAFLRDLVYKLIANNRYRWFGKSDTCRLPTPALRSRFLD